MTDRPETVVPERITISETGADYHFDAYGSRDWDETRFVCKRCGLTKRAIREQATTPRCFTKVAL